MGESHASTWVVARQVYPRNICPNLLTSHHWSVLRRFNRCGCVELFLVEGIEVLLMKRSLLSIDDREG